MNLSSSSRRPSLSLRRHVANVARHRKLVAVAAIASTSVSAMCRGNDNQPIWQGASLFNNNWSTAGNWETSLIGANNDVDNNGDDDVVIGGNPGRKTATVNQGYSIRSLNFEATSTGAPGDIETRTSFLVDGSGWLGIVAGVYNNSTYNNTVTAPIQFNGNCFVENDAPGAGSLSVDRLYLHGHRIVFMPGAKGIDVTGAVTGGEAGSEIEINGAGTVKFNASNSWSGSLLVKDNATLEYYSGPSLGSIGNIVHLESGATLRRATTGTTIAHIELYGGDCNLDVDAGQTTTYTGGISSEHASSTPTLNKTGLGTIALNGSITHSGPSYVRAGTLQIGGTAFLPNGALHVESGATLAYADGKEDTVGQLYGAGTIALNAGNRLQVGYATDTTGDGTWSGTITGSGARFTKGGSGVLTFASPNTYSGVTTVEAGTLIVSNPSGSATGSGDVDVKGGATLRGYGSIGGFVTLRNGGTLAPSPALREGGGFGTLTIGGLVSEAGGTLRMKIGSLGANAVADHVRITSNAFLTGVTLELPHLLTLDPDVAGATAPREYVHVDGAITGKFSAIAGQMITATRYFAINYSTHGINLSIAAPGDATLDGRVNFDDLLVVAQNYGATAGKTWATGDFNGNGAVNFDDLLSLSQNYGAGGALNSGGATPTGSFAADWALAQSLVPEPGSIAATLLAASIVRRRRR